MKVNELIERYVHEVGQHLPRKMRADIELELSSLLHDALEERAAAAGKEPNMKMAADVLREFGKPEVMAAQYRPEQYLIGPQLFSIYKLVLTIVLVIISVVHGAGLVFMLLRGETAVFGQDAWGWFGNYFQSAALNAGIVTLIFAAIERAQSVNWREQSPAEADWDPLLPGVVLAQGRWMRVTRWLELALVPLNVYILNRTWASFD